MWHAWKRVWINLEAHRVEVLPFRVAYIDLAQEAGHHLETTQLKWLRATPVVMKDYIKS